MIKLLAAVLIFCCAKSTLVAQTEATKTQFTRIWSRTNGDLNVSLDRFVTHEPAFIGEDRIRVRLQLRNRGKESVFVNAFDLSMSRNDLALLHDVFEGEQCHKARTSQQRDDNVSGQLGIGYSRLHTSSTIEIPPGKKLYFSVSKDHLSACRCVRVRYWKGIARPPLSEEGYRFLWLGPSSSH
jgi:hypothetical protein